jgi:Flp pilus assembly protein TadG
MSTPLTPSRPRRRRRSRLGDRRGQSLVEFAVVFPVFILLLAGMVDFGLALFSNVTIINAAREGARLGVTLTPAQLSAGTTVENRVMAMSTGLDPAKVNVTSTCVGSCSPAWSAGDSVKVNVSYTYSMVWPLTFGTSIPLASSVEMRIE